MGLIIERSNFMGRVRLKAAVSTSMIGCGSEVQMTTMVLQHINGVCADILMGGQSGQLEGEHMYRYMCS